MDITPSAFTPFFRRFTDEKARDLDDTRRLYDRVRSLNLASRYAEDDAEITFGGNVYATVSDRLSEPLRPVFIRLIAALISGEKVIFDLPSLNFDVVHLSLNELVDLRHFLRAKEHFLAHEDRVIGLLGDGISNIVGALANLLPETWDPSPFTVPLIYLLPEPKNFLDKLFGELWQQRYVDNGLFVDVSRRMYFNICEESGIADPQDPKKPFRHPSKNDKQLHEIVETYLMGTPFYEFFLAPVPLRFTHEDRFSHMHVLGGSGAGKTTLIQNLILHDLQTDDPPSLVIVDSQGDLINKLSRLDVFNPDGGALHDRLLIISPKDINLFQFADTPEQAFEMLRKGLTENYLVAEAAAGTLAESQEMTPGEDLMAGWTVEDFLGPEMAKTSK